MTPGVPISKPPIHIGLELRARYQTRDAFRPRSTELDKFGKYSGGAVYSLIEMDLSAVRDQG